MTAQQDPMDDELTHEYRRASEADAGTPSNATRAAILAQAQAAALQRLQPANDSRYVWRAVAGVAVVGIAVLIWRQADHGLPPTTPVRSAITSSANTESEEATEVGAADKAALREAPQESVAARARARASAPAASSAENRRDAQSVRAERSNAKATAPALAAAPAAAPTVAAQSNTGATATAGAAMADSTAATPLQRYFPEQDRSANPPAMLWLVLDVAGNVVRSGSRDTPADWSDINAEVIRMLDGRSPGPWRIAEVRNSQHQSIMLGIAQLP
jgi:hypothetical protein